MPSAPPPLAALAPGVSAAGTLDRADIERLADSGIRTIVNNRLDNGSYAAVAAALGADGYQVTHIDELGPALAKALAVRRPACIEVHVSLDPIPPEERVIMGGRPF